MQQFANIGISHIITACGIQSNQKIVESVPVMQADGKTYELEEKVIYKNEKNMYGELPKLNSGAFKLFLLIHFYHPDKAGFIRQIDISELSEILSCSTRTIINNMRILSEAGYISFGKIDSTHYPILISGYPSYFCTADQGGRGYITLSRELFLQLSILNVNELRIALRVLSSVSLSFKDQGSSLSSTFQDIHRWLPLYCKKGIITKCLEKLKNIFDISIKAKSIRLIVEEPFESRNMKQKLYNENRAELVNHFKEFESSALQYNKGITTSLNWLFRRSTYPEARVIPASSIDIDSLARLTVEFSIDMVLDAFYRIYDDYVNKFKKVDNLGGLTRTYILNQLNTVHIGTEVNA